MVITTDLQWMRSPDASTTPATASPLPLLLLLSTMLLLVLLVLLEEVTAEGAAKWVVGEELRSRIRSTTAPSKISRLGVARSMLCTEQRASEATVVAREKGLHVPQPVQCIR